MKGVVNCPSAQDLLLVWEAGLGRPGHERALLLLERACPGYSSADMAAWPVGRRDAALFRLREMLFGTACRSVVECPHCAAQVELAFATDDLLKANLVIAETGCQFELEAGGYRVRFRVPDSNDLAAVRAESDLASARRHLLERCVISLEPPFPSGVPESVEPALIRSIAEADPLAATVLTVVCGDCRHSWTEVFDIAAWLMSELSDWVKRMLREVHALAAAYGWGEADIIGMSPTRRQLYLDLLARG